MILKGKLKSTDLKLINFENAIQKFDNTKDTTFKF
jgi:hypothetical protein